MLKVGKYVMIESREDWNANYDARWDRFDDAFYPHDIDLTKFPIYMKYGYDELNPHACGGYSVISEEEWIGALTVVYRRVREKNENLKKLLDLYGN